MQMAQMSQHIRRCRSGLPCSHSRVHGVCVAQVPEMTQGFRKMPCHANCQTCQPTCDAIQHCRVSGHTVSHINHHTPVVTPDTGFVAGLIAGADHAGIRLVLQRLDARALVLDAPQLRPHRRLLAAVPAALRMRQWNMAFCTCARAEGQQWRRLSEILAAPQLCPHCRLLAAVPAALQSRYSVRVSELRGSSAYKPMCISHGSALVQDSAAASASHQTAPAC